MCGFRLEKESRENGWVITAWPGHDPVHTYWVENGEFSSATYDFNYSNRTRIKILGEATNIEQEAKIAILRAIKEWESAPLNNPS